MYLETFPILLYKMFKKKENKKNSYTLLYNQSDSFLFVSWYSNSYNNVTVIIHVQDI